MARSRDTVTDASQEHLADGVTLGALARRVKPHPDWWDVCGDHGRLSQKLLTKTIGYSNVYLLPLPPPSELCAQAGTHSRTGEIPAALRLTEANEKDFIEVEVDLVVGHGDFTTAEPQPKSRSTRGTTWERTCRSPLRPAASGARPRRPRASATCLNQRPKTGRPSRLIAVSRAASRPVRAGGSRRRGPSVPPAGSRPGAAPLASDTLIRRTMITLNT